MPRRVRSLGLVAGWVMAGAGAWTVGTSMFGIVWPWPTVAMQAVAPLLLFGAWPALGAALATRRRALSLVAAVVGVTHLWLVLPLVHRDVQPAWASNAATVRIGAANVLYVNERVDEAAAQLAGLDVEVLVLTEVTPEWMSGLERAGVFIRFPHRAGKSSAGNSIGSLVLSRIAPLSIARDLAVRRTVHSMTLPVGSSRFQVVAVHPQAPTAPGLVGSWDAQIDSLREIVRQADAPIALVGDLNASYLHPPYRRLLNEGLRDAHEVAGKGFTNSFPIGRLPIPIVRLDHALISRDVSVVSVDDFRLAGSDHAAFVVELAVRSPSE